MNQQAQIKALAELDGLNPCSCGSKDCFWSLSTGSKFAPNYLTSYDAILPLIQKQNGNVMLEVESEIQNIATSAYWYDATPSQLCEALLRATGKWKE